jgi:hypothetical protein
MFLRGSLRFMMLNGRLAFQGDDITILSYLAGDTMRHIT